MVMISKSKFILTQGVSSSNPSRAAFGGPQFRVRKALRVAMRKDVLFKT
jgi:hypothetical protein